MIPSSTTAAPAAAPEAIPGGKSAQTRKRILDAAAQVFVARGYKAASLSEIAQAASMKAGSLYFHFGSKDELICEVLQEGVMRTLKAVSDAVDAQGPEATARQRLCTAIDSHIAALRGHANYGAAVIRIVEEISPAVRDRFMSRNKAYTDYWNGLIRQAQREACLAPGMEPRIIRRILFGAMNSFDIRNMSAEMEAEARKALFLLLGLD